MHDPCTRFAGYTVWDPPLLSLCDLTPSSDAHRGKETSLEVASFGFLSKPRSFGELHAADGYLWPDFLCGRF